jgi:hypothetical protein
VNQANREGISDSILFGTALGIAGLVVITFGVIWRRRREKQPVEPLPPTQSMQAETPARELQQMRRASTQRRDV